MVEIIWLVMGMGVGYLLGSSYGGSEAKEDISDELGEIFEERGLKITVCYPETARHLKTARHF